MMGTFLLLLLAVAADVDDDDPDIIETLHPKPMTQP